MRRSLICIVALGVAIAGSSPVSLCAIASALATDCASAQTQSQCDRMDMGAPSAPALTARTAACCSITGAPLPEAKSPPSSPAPQQGVASILILAVEVVQSGHGHLVDVRQDSPPPPLQPLLCTFLI